ncbi:asparaginase [Gordonia desulfuricans]|uniref:asparaginase n=1 Tax=Gordonia desulfuricans TaxID=89051 RepID=A0A7K3LTE8_9ACTN|nr:asparaginase [Gordonia desulfuricans]NDK91509.1 asparaginase [Gordonia desulfuricans]
MSIIEASVAGAGALGHDRDGLRRCVVVGTGGTIGTRGSDPLDRNEYMYGGTSVDTTSTLDNLPDFPGRPELEAIAITDKPSHDLDAGDQLGLARVVEQLRARRDVDAVVVQHGTNTVEETAFTLDLLLPHGKPVVLVGSMRPSGVVGTDADSNLIDAIRLAMSPAAANRGVLVSLGGRVFAARDVTKIDSRSLAGFGAPVLGPIGLVEPDGEVFLSGAAPPDVAMLGRIGDATELPRVDIVVSHCTADGTLIEAACAAGARGVVCAGTGAGFPTARQVAALRAAAANGVLVCRSSRIASAYVTPPSRTSTDPDPDFLWSAHLNAYQARIALSIALAAGSTADARRTAQELFARF